MFWPFLTFPQLILLWDAPSVYLTGYPCYGTQHLTDSISHKGQGSTLLFFNWSIVDVQCSLAAQVVKNPPAMQETWVWSLGQEDPLEKGKATQSSILAWRIQWTEEPGRLQSMGSERVGHDWINTHNRCSILSQYRSSTRHFSRK